jgi:hypothetical protein
VRGHIGALGVPGGGVGGGHAEARPEGGSEGGGGSAGEAGGEVDESVCEEVGFLGGGEGGWVSVAGAEWDMLAAWWWCGKKEEKKAPDHGGLSARIAGSKNCAGADISGCQRTLVVFARQVNFVGLDHENSPTIFSAWLWCRDRLFRS